MLFLNIFHVLPYLNLILPLIAASFILIDKFLLKDNWELGICTAHVYVCECIIPLVLLHISTLIRRQPYMRVRFVQ